MKKIYEIPKCKKLLDEMFVERNKLPRTGKLDENQDKIKEIESRYLPKIFAEADKYKKEHPEEFED